VILIQKNKAMGLINVFPRKYSLVCFVAITFLLNEKNLVITDDYFSLKESKELNKILVYTGNLPSGSFYKKTNNSWQLNDNINVDEKMSALLLAVLKDVKIQERIDKSKKEQVRQYLKKKGLVVEYYYHDLLAKAIYFATDKEIPGRTYAMTEEDEEPFVVYVPNARVEIEQMFSKPNFQWRDQTLFDNDYQNIQSVSLEYQSAKDSFEITKSVNGILLDGETPNSVDRITKYLGGFNSIEAAGKLTDNEILLDSLKLSKPYCVIKVEDKMVEKSRHLSIYLSNDNLKIVYGRFDYQKEAFIIPYENIKSLLLKKADLNRKLG
jgi:sulfur carrier protein ThiS